MKQVGNQWHAIPYSMAFRCSIAALPVVLFAIFLTRDAALVSLANAALGLLVVCLVIAILWVRRYCVIDPVKQTITVEWRGLKRTRKSFGWNEVNCVALPRNELGFQQQVYLEILLRGQERIFVESCDSLESARVAGMALASALGAGFDTGTGTGTLNRHNLAEPLRDRLIRLGLLTGPGYPPPEVQRYVRREGEGIHIASWDSNGPVVWVSPEGLRIRFSNKAGWVAYPARFIEDIGVSVKYYRRSGACFQLDIWHSGGKRVIFDGYTRGMFSIFDDSRAELILYQWVCRAICYSLVLDVANG